MKMHTIFLDGQYKKIPEKALKSFSPGQLKGLGVFETLLCEGRKVFFLKEHYNRFVHGCDLYILPKPPAFLEIKNILAKLLDENQIKDGRIRLESWRRGCHLHFAVVVVERVGFSEKVYHRGFSACIYPRRMDRSFHLAKIKSLDYGFFLKGYEYALKNHCQEAIFLNSSGEVVEASRSNIFVIKDRKLLTPPLSSGCLAGVTRAAVLSLAKGLKIKISTSVVTLAGLQNCDEAFLTNALVGIMPLVNFAGHKIGGGLPGAMTKRLARSYKKLSEARGSFLV